jgi:hypothetical protein
MSPTTAHTDVIGSCASLRRVPGTPPLILPMRSTSSS